MNEPFEQRFALLSLEEYKETLERLKRLEALCTQAADALDGATRMIRTNSESELIAELRKAAQ
jgi:hypothetical protein